MPDPIDAMRSAVAGGDAPARLETAAPPCPECGATDRHDDTCPIRNEPIQTVTVPDESGMAEETVEIGVPFWNPDVGAWVVQVDKFTTRHATDAEAEEGRRRAGAAGHPAPAPASTEQGPQRPLVAVALTVADGDVVEFGDEVDGTCGLCSEKRDVVAFRLKKYPSGDYGLAMTICGQCIVKAVAVALGSAHVKAGGAVEDLAACAHSWVEIEGDTAYCAYCGARRSA